MRSKTCLSSKGGYIFPNPERDSHFKTSLVTWVNLKVFLHVLYPCARLNVVGLLRCVRGIPCLSSASRSMASSMNVGWVLDLVSLFHCCL